MGDHQGRPGSINRYRADADVNESNQTKPNRRFECGAHHNDWWQFKRMEQHECFKDTDARNYVNVHIAHIASDGINRRSAQAEVPPANIFR